jgi:hypothetical protein
VIVPCAPRAIQWISNAGGAGHANPFQRPDIPRRAMSSFNDREKGFENKFKHDQELQFKVEARRNKLLGLWAAEFLGLERDAAAAYAKEVVQSDFEEPGDEDVFRKVWGDFQEKGVDKSEHQLRRQMEELMTVARQEVMKEVK